MIYRSGKGQRVEQIHGVNVFIATTTVADDRDAVDLIAQAHYDHQATWVVLPVDLLPDQFFQLQTGMAGAIAQKFVSYRMGLAVVGDVSSHIAASTSFRDWVRETNKGRHVWFVQDLAAFSEQLDCPHGRGSDGAGA